MRNAELLEKVAEAIEDHPDNWDQARILTGPAGFERVDLDCGITMCIGGWAMFLQGWSLMQMQTASMRDIATELGLTTEEEIDLLFLGGMESRQHANAHKEVAEWLRSLARGESARTAMPDWWEE